MDGLEGSLGRRHSQDGGIYRMAGFSRSLPMLFARGSLGRHYLASSRNAHDGLGPVLQLGGVSSARPVRDPHPGALGHNTQATQSIPGNVAGATALWAGAGATAVPADAGQLPKIITRAAAGSAMWGWGPWPTCPPPPRSHSDPLRGTRAAITRRRSLRHRDVGKLLEATQ